MKTSKIDIGKTCRSRTDILEEDCEGLSYHDQRSERQHSTGPAPQRLMLLSREKGCCNHSIGPENPARRVDFT
jgi:hypothetical protein